MSMNTNFQTGDLFAGTDADDRHDVPLARRMSPRDLDGLLGQDHILGENCILRRAVEADRITSLIRRRSGSDNVAYPVRSAGIGQNGVGPDYRPAYGGGV